MAETLSSDSAHSSVKEGRYVDWPSVRTLVGAAWDGIGSLAFSANGMLLASGGSGREEGGIVRIWDVETGKLQHTMSTQFRRGGNSAVTFSPDGEALFAVGPSHDTEATWQVHTWEANKGSHQGMLLSRPGSARAIAVSPDGSKLAVGTWEGNVFLINLQHEEKVRESQRSGDDRR